VNSFSKCLVTAAIGLGAVVLPLPLIALSNTLIWQLSFVLPAGLSPVLTLALPLGFLAIGVVLYGSALYALVRIWRKG
jgi:hypothetical protein